MSARLRIGTQGWNYDDWSTRFYPSGTSSVDRLAAYARVFDTVEIDSTFYAMPPVGRFRSWYERTPAHFVFTAKLPREITHERRLRGVDRELMEFCDRASELQEKLGPLLVQLPPDMSPRERDAVEAFIPQLPAELPFAIEFRDPDWFDERTLALLHSYRVTLAVSVGPWLGSEQALGLAAVAPGEFMYLRWMGSPRHQTLNPTMVRERDEQLSEWARMVVERDRPVTYAYFNNDYQGHSPDSARRLRDLLGVPTPPLSEAAEQVDLFGGPG